MGQTRALRFGLVGIVGSLIGLSTWLGIRLYAAIHYAPVILTITGVAVVVALGLLLYVAYWLNRILNYIDMNVAFSEASLEALQKIKTAVLRMSVVLSTTLIAFYQASALSGSFGILIVGMGFVVVPFAVYVFCSVLEKLLERAIETTGL
jgi:Na+-transporting methylmalonyl-CoA/oxaloacetate decarboxylase gamma subunit